MWFSKRNPTARHGNVINSMVLQLLFDRREKGHKYLVVYSKARGIERTMCFDDAGYWKSMPMAEDARIKSHVSLVKFSSSEQHTAALNPKKVFIISLDGRGCWISSREIGLDRPVQWVSFFSIDRIRQKITVNN